MTNVIQEAWMSFPQAREVDAGESPNASVVATGVRGDPTVPRQLRIDLGTLLHRAYHAGDDRIVVHMDDLERLCNAMGVDFEIDTSRLLIPLPQHVDDGGREITEDELQDES